MHWTQQAGDCNYWHKGDIRHRLFNAGELAIEAFETRVWTGRHPDDPNRMKSVPIPDEIVRALKGEAKPA